MIFNGTGLGVDGAQDLVEEIQEALFLVQFLDGRRGREVELLRAFGDAG